MFAKFSRLAIADLKHITDYLIDQASASIALSVTDNIESTIQETLLDNPKVGMRVNYSGKVMRCFPVKKYNAYSIFYAVEVKHIFIVRILHGKRDIASIFQPDRKG